MEIKPPYSHAECRDVILLGAQILETPGLPSENTVKEVFGVMVIALAELLRENAILKNQPK